MIRMAAGVAMVGAMMLAATSGAAAQAGDPDSPGAPVNVRVVAESDASVTVAWDAPVDEHGRAAPTGYKVLYRMAGSAPGSQPVVARGWYGLEVGADRSEGTVEGLMNGEWYQMVVVSLPEGGWSESVLARPGAELGGGGLAGVPTDVRVVAEGRGSVTVGWDAPVDDGGSAVTGYEVWYISRQDWGDDDEWVRSGGVLGADVRELVVSGLVDFVEYHVVVAAVNGVGRGLFSDVLWAVAGRDDLDPPGAPVNVRVVSMGDGSVTVAWDAPAEENGRPSPSGYRVRHRVIAATAAGTQPNPSKWLGSVAFGADAHEGTVRGLTNDTWYEFRVESIAGNWSDSTVLARPGDTPVEVGLPGVPTDVRVVAKGRGSVTVGWDAPVDDGGSAVTGYEVWYISRQDWGDDDEWVRSGGVLGADVRELVVSGLVDYVEYHVVVAAVNGVGRGPFVAGVYSGLFTIGEWAVANRDDLDLLGLIADHRFVREYLHGIDMWEVWICDVSDGHESIDLEGTVALLNRGITPYFSWLSGGMYRPEFIAGGRVAADPGLSSDHAGDYECHDRVAEVVDVAEDGVLRSEVIVLDKDYVLSNGWRVVRRADTYTDRVRQPPAAFPETGRGITLTSSTVLPVSVFCSDCRYPDEIGLGVVAHEMGHALGWPHSFGGNRPVTSELHIESGQEVNEYDNPMDMMSQRIYEPQLGEHGLVAGTIAVNRYAAGWIEPGDVAIHGGGVAAYQLAPVGTSGTQMLVIPTGESGHFVSLGARVARGYDQGIPAEGVEVYRIDQRASVCFESPINPDQLACADARRRTQQVPPPPNDDREVEELTDHVYGPGEALTVEGYRVEVTERVGDLFRVWVGNPYKGTFADDENSAHEGAIETLVRLGITDGCNPDLKLFCPDGEVTRAQLAVFLIRALGETPASGSGPSMFSDVDADAWYRPYVDRLAELGITSGYGDGTYRPKDMVTRAQMAVFLTRAFDRIGAVETPAGVFDDVPASASYAGAVEGILAAGVTSGCNKTPGRNYCPNQPVKRSQMASFLTRAIEVSR